MRKALDIGPRFKVGQRIYISRDLIYTNLPRNTPVIVSEVLSHETDPPLHSYKVVTMDGYTYYFSDQTLSATK